MINDSSDRINDKEKGISGGYVIVGSSAISHSHKGNKRLNDYKSFMQLRLYGKLTAE
jgi:hypothetical protein